MKYNIVPKVNPITQDIITLIVSVSNIKYSIADIADNGHTIFALLDSNMNEKKNGRQNTTTK